MAGELTPFQKKFDELDKLKKESLKLMAKFNSLHLEYEDWFKRQRQTFLNIMKSLQVGSRSLVPQKINTVQDFRTVIRVATEMSSNSQQRPGMEQLHCFMRFWERYQQLKQELDSGIMQRFISYCQSVQRLRQPEVKEHIDDLYVNLNRQYSERFNFCGVNNEKDHLYTYKVSTCDSDFHGLVGYVPFLIGYSTKICFHITKVHLEKI